MGSRIRGATRVPARNQSVGPRVWGGLPLLRLCALIDLASSAVLEAATGPHEGVVHSDLDLSRTLLIGLAPSDVLLVDALSPSTTGCSPS